MKAITTIAILAMSLFNNAIAHHQGLTMESIGRFIKSANRNEYDYPISFVKKSLLRPNYLIVKSEYCLLIGKEMQTKCGYSFDAIDMTNWNDNKDAIDHYNDIRRTHYFGIQNLTFQQCDDSFTPSSFPVPSDSYISHIDQFQDCSSMLLF